MHYTRNRLTLWLTAIEAAAVLTLTGPANAQVAAGFYGNSGGNDVGVSWNLATNATASPANLSGGSNVALFGVSASANYYNGVADGGPDGAGVFQGIIWNGVNGSTPTALLDSGTQGGNSTPGVDTPWSVNSSGFAGGQGAGQIAGYDVGFFAGIYWTPSGTAIFDGNAYFTDPAGNPVNSSTYYGGPLYIEYYDYTGIGLSAVGLNDNFSSSGVAFQNFGSFYYQGAIGNVNGKIYIIPYTDAADPAATCWNISSNNATCGYAFSGGLTVAYGYTATVNISGYTFGAGGGTGTLNNYGQGPNSNFQWFVDTNDSGNGSGQAIGFDINSTGSYNHAVYDANDHTSQEIADDRGGNTTFLVGVANDGASAGFETIAADQEADFHGWGTKPGTPGATTDFPEPAGTVGSKFFEVSSGGSSGPGVQTFTGAEKTVKGKATFKAIALKHSKTAKVSVVLTSAAGAGGQVVTVTSSNTADIANFTATVPAGSTFVYNVKTPKVSKTAKGQTVTLTASAPGGSQSVTVTIK